MAEPAVVRMANDIARQFAHLSDDDAAVAVRGHVESFWDPRMRRALLDEVHRDPARLDPSVVRAFASLVEPPVSVVEPPVSVVEPVETTP